MNEERNDLFCRHEPLADVAARLDARLQRIEALFEVLPVLIACAGVDPTHLPIPGAAMLLGVSETTIRRRIRRGELSLEIVPGTRRTGIPIEELCDGWMPFAVAQSALAREREQLALHKEKTGRATVEG